MKAKVIETGETIEVQCLYPTTYSRLDCNGKIIEEYDEDELEFPPKPKMISIDKAVEWLDGVIYDYLETGQISDFEILKGVDNERFINDFRKAMEA